MLCAMKRHMIAIGDFEYIKDETNSYHRILSQEERNMNLRFYKNHIYIDGDFENEDSIKKMSSKELHTKLQNDLQRHNNAFEVLKKWELLPTHNLNILDIGCGTGMFVYRWIYEKHGNGYGVDISPLVTYVSPARDVIEIIDLNSINAPSIPSDVSLIVARDIIEHLFEVTHLLSAVKIGVSVFIEIPIIPQGFTEADLMDYKYLHPTRHLHFYTQQGIEQELTKSGFRIIKSELIKNNLKYLILVEKWKH